MFEKFIRDTMRASDDARTKNKRRTEELLRKSMRGSDPEAYDQHAENDIRRLTDELNQHKALLREAADEVERLEQRLRALNAVSGLLKARGVKALLLAHWHPDKHPDADAELRRKLTQMMQTINDAYEVIG
jgi:polyhydroxyalkanoate synthesis regulator phasin